MACSLLSLPAETLFNISGYLSAPDVLHVVSSHSVFYRSCGKSPSFWRGLRHAQYPTSSRSPNESYSPESDDDTSHLSQAKAAKDGYLLHAHCDALSTVRWNSAMSRTVPAAREGHVCCQMGHFVVMTGGFTDDTALYVKDIRVTTSSWVRVQPAAEVARDRTMEMEWVYGATLTALDDSRAIRFGGFQSGGYSDESCQIAILHFNPVNMIASWEAVECKRADGSVIDLESYVSWANIAARAYHAATLLSGRYLVILGGMQSGGSILSPMVLDCHTWTWCVDGVTTNATRDGIPSPRHGCSIVSDVFRNRLVMFGGGSGSDLLRSGRDNTEVWALNLNGFDESSSAGSSGSTGIDLNSSLPWTWQCIHTDQAEEGDEENHSEQPGLNHRPNRLSPVERLNLGRCHSGYRTSRDSVILLFGSGRPSATNSLLGYCLSSDEFFRPTVCGTFLPRARFTFASTFVEALGYIVVHGGFSNQDTSVALSDTVILDLAPTMRRRPLLRWGINTRAESFPNVTNEMVAVSNFGSSQSMMHHIIETLMQSDQANRPVAAARIIANYEGTNRLEERFTTFLHLIASGRAELMEGGSISMREAADDDSSDDE